MYRTGGGLTAFGRVALVLIVFVVVSAFLVELLVPLLFVADFGLIAILGVAIGAVWLRRKLGTRK